MKIIFTQKSGVMTANYIHSPHPAISNLGKVLMNTDIQKKRKIIFEQSINFRILDTDFPSLNTNML